MADNFQLKSKGWAQEAAVLQGHRDDFDNWEYVSAGSGCPKCGAQHHAIDRESDMYLSDLVGVSTCNCKICGLRWVQEYSLVPSICYIDDISLERGGYDDI